ncbi:hypothetical protein SKAU_G00348190 [Synaphobranchus kaupii]|uniref:Uncharacterized protein n=1 Tax=Synaphobranchus kaupii TaxID=118154 RepID=A0A9Q1IHW2_SYNKA|nr:hypothetical protein SKAU_G00348190 [Synaphobranchus kaupii]
MATSSIGVSQQCPGISHGTARNGTKPLLPPYANTWCALATPRGTAARHRPSVKGAARARPAFTPGELRQAARHRQQQAS